MCTFFIVWHVNAVPGDQVRSVLWLSGLCCRHGAQISGSYLCVPVVDTYCEIQIVQRGVMASFFV